MSHVADGFKMISLRHHTNRNTGHEVFVKELVQNRSTADHDLAIGKTIFVVNVPPYVHAKHLEFGFAPAGKVSHVFVADEKGRRVALPHPNDLPSPFFNQIPQLNTFKSAYVVFQTTKAMRAALELRVIKLYANNKSVLESGVDKWTNEYMSSLPVAAELSASVEQYMQVFDESELERKQTEKQQNVDDDGWQVVKGRNAGFEQKESILKKLEDKVEDGKKKKELSNFYTFQIRDSKQQHIVGLRRRFENDKRKIEVMKNNRRFKPY